MTYRVDYTTDAKPLVPVFEFEDAAGNPFTAASAKLRARTVSKREDVSIAYAILCDVPTQSDLGVVSYANGIVDSREGVAI